MISMMILGVTVSIITQIFTESNYLYVCKIVLASSSEEECLEKIKLTKVSSRFFAYFSRAHGSFLAIMLIVSPFIVIREELHMGENGTYF